MKLGVPTLNRYDLLQELFDSAERGSLKPDGYILVDNGGQARQKLRLPENTVLIEPGKNLGVAASWNLLIEAAGEETVVISNDDIALGASAFATLVEASVSAPIVTLQGSWSLFAQSQECTRQVGFYDENFWPGYYEDEDYRVRLNRIGMPRKEIPLDCTHVGSATRSVSPGAIHGGISGEYFRAKWGGPPERVSFHEPFNGRPPAGWTLRNPAKRWRRRRRRSIIDYMYQRQPKQG